MVENQRNRKLQNSCADVKRIFEFDNLLHVILSQLQYYNVWDIVFFDVEYQYIQLNIAIWQSFRALTHKKQAHIFLQIYNMLSENIRCLYFESIQFVLQFSWGATYYFIIKKNTCYRINCNYVWNINSVKGFRSNYLVIVVFVCFYVCWHFSFLLFASIVNANIVCIYGLCFQYVQYHNFFNAW